MNDAELKSLLEDGNQVVSELASEILRLRTAIRTHRDKTGHELCWLNDTELWKMLGEDFSYPHKTLPVREEFLKQCSRFYESRIAGTPYAEPQPDQLIGNNRGELSE